MCVIRGICLREQQKTPKVSLTHTILTGGTGQWAQELENEIFTKFHTDRAGAGGDLAFTSAGGGS